jgi:putative ATP-dependent endonuclease of the OLD family
MKIVRIRIDNFRGIKNCEIFLNGHTVFVGDNNTGKSTILEAIDLVLGPERLSRYPVIDEHDFYAGEYIGEEDNEIKVTVEVIVSDLTDEQQRKFNNHIEWWNCETKKMIEGPPPEATDQKIVSAALRVGFEGYFDAEEDDFFGKSFFKSPLKDDDTYDFFGNQDKRLCGFLFLRTLRTGSRALSLEKGSLLDVILKLREIRPKMWEEILSELRSLPVASNPDLGISDILTSVQKSIRSFVPSDWAENPQLRVSDLTRSHLRKVLTVFMSTGEARSDGSIYAAPFKHQGTGTINMLVLALLSMIADLKQNVIFAMEEPEIAIPPHTQKRIINSVTSSSAQAIFTSHSPYVLEEFKPEEILVIKRKNGVLEGMPASYPPTVKPKKYREEFRRRFCEALLARRVLLAEGRTEYDAFPAAARRLNQLHQDEFKTLESLGIAIVNAETDSQIAPLGEFYTKLGKIVFAVFDKQDKDAKTEIEKAVTHPHEAPYNTLEKVIISETSDDALIRYALSLVAEDEWPNHLNSKTPTKDMTADQIKDSLTSYFKWSKGSGGIADLLSQSSRDEMPDFIIKTLKSIQHLVELELSEKTIVKDKKSSVEAQQEQASSDE